MKRFWTVGLGLFGAVLMCSAQKPVPLTKYMDRGHGVGFQYPSAWKPTTDPSYFGAAFGREQMRPIASFAFSPKGNLYEKTVLLGLTFNYFVVPSPNLNACVEEAKAGANADAAPKKVRINGVSFVEVSGTDAGMCHQRSSEVDVTWRSGQCLIFERDFDTQCDGVGDGKRALTLQEGKALQRHLDQVMQSVRLR